MNMRRATLAIALVLAFATVAAAQTPAPSLASSLTIGQRVRVHSNAEPRLIIGGVSAVDDEFLTVVPDGWSPVKISARQIGPRGAGTQDPEHRVEHTARLSPRAPAPIGPRPGAEHRLEYGPLLVGQVHACAVRRYRAGRL